VRDLAIVICSLSVGCAGTPAAPVASDDAGNVGKTGTDAATGAGVGVGGSDCPSVSALFDENCSSSSCHSAENKAQGLDLASPDVAARLVNVPATEGPGLLIDPSAPAESILYLKLMPHPPFGAQMPIGASPLSASAIACVFAWITEGTSNENGGTSDDGGGELANPSPDASSAVFATDDGGSSCQTSIDSYGNTQCACLQGQVAASNAVASCTGYDCCVRYAPDSGLAEGFGNPTQSSGLCACYSSADIAATLGGPVSCDDFANGEGNVVSSCP
jgi:hypothetical protein